MNIRQLLVVAAIAAGSSTSSYADAPISTDWSTLSNLLNGQYNQGYTAGAAGSFNATYTFTLPSAAWFRVEVDPFWGITVNSATLSYGASSVPLTWDGGNTDFRAVLLGTASTVYSLNIVGSATGGGNSFNNTVTAVPEPETFAMLLAGLGLIGLVSRRRMKLGAV